jgi:hypothetical protein
MSASRDIPTQQENVDDYNPNLTVLYSTTCLSGIYFLLSKSSPTSRNGFFSNCCPAISRFVANMLNTDSDDEDENEQLETLSSVKISR